MNYLTRERIHVDRIATAWAIRTFIDPQATFQFVPRTRDVRSAPYGFGGVPNAVGSSTRTMAFR